MRFLQYPFAPVKQNNSKKKTQKLARKSEKKLKTSELS